MPHGVPELLAASTHTPLVAPKTGEKQTPLPQLPQAPPTGEQVTSGWVVVVVVLVLVVSQGFGVQIRPSKKRPPAAKHWGRLTTAHWSKGPPGVLCVQHAEGGVVVLVVVVVGPHAGSVGSVQEQNVSPLILHWSRTNLLQALKSVPDKPAHPAAISSAHCFEPQSGCAALGPETKTPAPSATAANVTPAFLVIVGPP
jgi:hypothetical protein